MSETAVHKEEQRRGALRSSDISLTVKLKATDAGADTPVLLATVRNLSATGAMLTLKDRVSIDDVFDLEFSTPTRHPFVFKAKIVRLTASQDGTWEAGVRFGFTFADETALILWLISKVEKR